MGGAAVPPPDYAGLQTNILKAGKRQTANNRLNTANPFASQTFNPDGSTSTQFAGGMGQAAAGLDRQVAGLGQALDPAQFGAMLNGDDARNQAISSGYGRAEALLNPQWQKWEGQQAQQLMNEGLDPTSSQYQERMQDFGGMRDDAYSSAMNSAIGQGAQAGNSLFSRGQTTRQQAISEALQSRAQPLEEMRRMQQLLGQPQYAMDDTTLRAALGAGGIAQNGYDQALGKANADNAWFGETMSGVGNLAGSLGNAAVKRWGNKP